jgi:hypothetical protein
MSDEKYGQETDLVNKTFFIERKEENKEDEKLSKLTRRPAQTKLRYVVEVNIEFQHVDSDETEVITKYLDFGSRRNYRVYEGDSFDTVYEHIPPKSDEWFSTQEYFEPTRFVRERLLTREIIRQLIIIPLAREKHDSDSESENTDQD